MVKRVPVNAVDYSAVLQHPVAESNELGFRCKIAFVSQGTRVQFEDKVHTTDKAHWLDMDVDDFSEVFDENPDDIEMWFEDVWQIISAPLEHLENKMPEARGGIASSAATQAMISSMASMSVSAHAAAASSAALSAASVQLKASDLRLDHSFGMKVMRPKLPIIKTNVS